ncbi:MAG: hypothetical protein PHN88_12245 [Ignavibacteria bacterium]|nr:hypothetical protein [Ignavibacteria bacterium]
MEFDFTLKRYGRLLNDLKECGYRFYTINDWIQKAPAEGVVIRHDVDRKANNSLKTAMIESEKGIKATYYFRITRGSFIKEIIKEIAGMGHEIGYHYEDLTTFKGDLSKSIESFKLNLAKLREAAEIKTIAMHGKPTSKFNNLDIWKQNDCRDFGLNGEAYLTIDYSDVHYYSDTGRSWRSSSKSNYKDYTGGKADEKVKCTDDLSGFIKKEKPGKLILMTHPERWNDNFAGYTYYLFRDKITTNVKVLLSFFMKR